jgi:hypothetical protein
MGNINLKAEFDTESITGKKWSPFQHQILKFCFSQKLIQIQ